MAGTALDGLINMLARLPGLGPRSAKRVALHLLKHRDTVMRRLAVQMMQAAEKVQSCALCGNLDETDPCAICSDPERESRRICVVEGVDDLWAMERAGVFSGHYHVLGGTLSAIDGIGPEDLGVDRLLARIDRQEVVEVILATNATVDGQTTAHYLTERLAVTPVEVTGLAHGVPVGGEVNYLDEGTLGTALRARRPLRPASRDDA